LKHFKKPRVKKNLIENSAAEGGQGKGRMVSGITRKKKEATKIGFERRQKKLAWTGETSQRPNQLWGQKRFGNTEMHNTAEKLVTTKKKDSLDISGVIEMRVKINTP